MKSGPKSSAPSPATTPSSVICPDLASKPAPSKNPHRRPPLLETLTQPVQRTTTPAAYPQTAIMGVSGFSGAELARLLLASPPPRLRHAPLSSLASPKTPPPAASPWNSYTPS